MNTIATDFALDRDELLRVSIIERLATMKVTVRGTPQAIENLKTAGVTVDWDRHIFLDNERPFGEDDKRVHMHVHGTSTRAGYSVELVLDYK